MAKSATSVSAIALIALVPLGACTSTDAGMGMTPRAPLAATPETDMAALGSIAAATPASASGASSAPRQRRANAGPIQFLPVVGAPQDKVLALSQALSESAERSGIVIAGSDAPATPRRLKGYLSAIGEGEETVVVFVFDIVDPSGNRIDRIQGQERVPRQAADAWSVVDTSVLERIAARTLDALS